jgi:uncharacterized protein YqgC (DUF456 family)
MIILMPADLAGETIERREFWHGYTIASAIMFALLTVEIIALAIMQP